MVVAILPFASFTNALLLSNTTSHHKPFKSPTQIYSYSHLPVSSSISPSPPPPFRSTSHRRIPNHSQPQDWTTQQQQYQHQQQQNTLLVETFHQNITTLRALLGELSKKGSSPLRLLRRDGDWTKDQLWAVFRFLIETGRIKEALQVFDFWKNKEMSRINEVNYSRLIRLLSEVSLMEEAVSSLRDMAQNGLTPSLASYNYIIHGFARKREFDSAGAYFRKLVEIGLTPSPETYNGLIQAYGDYAKYDEMSKCVKRMESEGCSPNEVTYNILIGQFARGGLLERMEGVFRTLLSKRMNLQPSTLVIMLEAYADLGILEKMEKVYSKVLHSKAFLKENLIRKLALVYIENYRFSRLEEFGNEVGSKSGRTDLVWCILLLSCACLSSRKGMESIIREMELAKVGSNITFTNAIALFYTKIKDFRTLDTVLSQAGTQNLKLDIVTVGILFDACMVGYDGSQVLEIWRRNRSLEEVVGMKTDPLVLSVFGKGVFIKNCEKVYSSLGSKAKDKKLWTYSDLISLVFGTNRRKAQLLQVG